MVSSSCNDFLDLLHSHKWPTAITTSFMRVIYWSQCSFQLSASNTTVRAKCQAVQAGNIYCPKSSSQNKANVITTITTPRMAVLPSQLPGKRLLSPSEPGVCLLRPNCVVCCCKSYSILNPKNSPSTFVLHGKRLPEGCDQSLWNKWESFTWRALAISVFTAYCLPLMA